MTEKYNSTQKTLEFLDNYFSLVQDEIMRDNRYTIKM